MAPEVGFEPTTNRLTADRSTTELLRNYLSDSVSLNRLIPASRDSTTELLRNHKGGGEGNPQIGVVSRDGCSKISRGRGIGLFPEGKSRQVFRPHGVVR